VKVKNICGKFRLSRNVGDTTRRSRGALGTQHANPLRLECVSVEGPENSGHGMLRRTDHPLADGT
jgi:hypothetical protein